VIKIEDITPGQSYACKFKVEHMLDQDGNLSDGEGSIFELGTYEGLGIIITRDTEQRLVKVKDQASSKEFVVSYDSIWDVDDVEWADAQ
jgi:hypothetical protein|tara:strand:+ start:296 stop:562 length:267 start_codon:yes stop_codon:yes gene_type:complete